MKCSTCGWEPGKPGVNAHTHTFPKCSTCGRAAPRPGQTRCDPCQQAWDARTAADAQRAGQSARFRRARVWTGTA